MTWLLNVSGVTQKVALKISGHETDSVFRRYDIVDLRDLADATKKLELGIPPESAAVSLKAAKEALLRVMPDSEANALSPVDLFQAAVIPSRTTGNRALRELLSAGKIQRIGKARSGHPCRYFKRNA